MITSAGNESNTTKQNKQTNKENNLAWFKTGDAWDEKVKVNNKCRLVRFILYDPSEKLRWSLSLRRSVLL